MPRFKVTIVENIDCVYEVVYEIDASSKEEIQDLIDGKLYSRCFRDEVEETDRDCVKVFHDEAELYSIEEDYSLSDIT